MTQQATLRALDAALMAEFSAAGLADAAVYTQVGGSPLSCTVYVDRGVQLTGFDTQVRTDSVTITAQRAEIGELLPKRGAIFVVGSTSFKVDQILNADESRVVCLVVDD